MKLGPNQSRLGQGMNKKFALLSKRKVSGVRFRVSGRRVAKSSYETLIHSAIIDCGSGFQTRFTRSGIYLNNEVLYKRRRWPRASSQIEKETNER